MKWILRYMLMTKYLFFYTGGRIILKDFIDSNMARDVNGRSTTGYLFTFEMRHSIGA